MLWYKPITISLSILHTSSHHRCFSSWYRISSRTRLFIINLLHLQLLIESLAWCSKRLITCLHLVACLTHKRTKHSLGICIHYCSSGILRSIEYSVCWFWRLNCSLFVDNDSLSLTWDGWDTLNCRDKLSHLWTLIRFNRSIWNRTTTSIVIIRLLMLVLGIMFVLLLLMSSQNVSL